MSEGGSCLWATVQAFGVGFVIGGLAVVAYMTWNYVWTRKGKG